MKKIITLLALVLCINVNAQFTKLLDFSGANGSTPSNELISLGTYLYGTANQGGTNNRGIIFRIKPNGTGDSVIFNFSGVADGSNPVGSLFFDGTFLYGTTSAGGTNSSGVFFKIKPDGTGYIKLLDFSGATDGYNPTGTLISDGTYFYGVTSSGGANNYGTIFKIKPDGTRDTTLHEFLNFGDGRNPVGSLIYDGNFLYGMTGIGGINGFGIMFQIKPDGTGYSKLFDFGGATTNGANPHGSLITDGTFFYGTTNQGGTSGMGTIFRIKPDGTGDTALYNFSGVNGKWPVGSLYYDGTFLYGMTENGGTALNGVIFKIKPNGTGYTKLFDFIGTSTGINPYGTGSLLSDGTFLYGMTSSGGTGTLCTGGCGVIFKCQFAPCVSPTASYTMTQDPTPQTWDVYPSYSTNVNNARWYWGDGSSTLGLYPSHTYSATGRYNICVAAYSNCGDSAISCQNDTVYRLSNNMSNSMVYVNILNKIPTISVNSPVICVGDSIMLTASGANTYTWSTGAIGKSIVLSPAATTSYTVTGTNGIGFTNTSTTKITVNTLPVITVNTSTICAGGTTTLTANGANTYTWNTMATGAIISPSPTITTNYTVIGTGTNNCKNTATSTIAVKPLPNIIVNSPNICIGETATLTASGANTYTWNTGATGITISTSPTITTNYTISGTGANNCKSTNTSTVTVNLLPIITVNTATICEGGSATLTASGANTYTWSTGETTTTISISPTVTITYSLTGTDANNCVNATISTITVNTSPVITGSITTSTPTCISSTFNGGILPVSEATSYNWNITGVGTIISGQGTPNIDLEVPTNGSYTISVTASNGCGAGPPSSIIVNVNPSPSVSITAGSTTSCVGETFVLNVPFSIDTTYDWVESDGNTGIGSTYTITNMPSSPNPYLVTVAATYMNCTGATATYSILTSNCITTGINQTNEYDEVKLYPNPTNSSFTIEITNADKQTLQVFDVNGKLVLNQAINGKTNIDTTNLSEGVYNLSIINPDGIINKKLVILR